MRQDPSTALIGLGSNLGDREGYIRRAVEWLERHPRIAVERCSTMQETLPWGVLEQPRFINAVVRIRTSLCPRELLASLKSAEVELGRNTESVRWGPREIDLDILLYDDLIIDDADLKIPHERLAERPFVMEQILELDPSAVHPALGVPIRSLLA